MRMSLLARVPSLAGVVAGATLLATLPSPAAAQGVLGRLKDKARDKVEQCVDDTKSCKKQKSGDSTQTAKPSAPQGSGQQSGSQSGGQPAGGGSDASPVSNGAAESVPPGRGVWLNYDFVPGDRTIFYEDFSGNEVGDFPRRFRLQEGNLEVVDVKGKKMLRSADGGHFFIKLPEKLPPRFTVEVVYHSGALTNPLHIETTESTYERSASFGCYSNQAWVDGNHIGPNSGNAFQNDAMPGFVTCAFTIDNARGIKGYVDEHRTANAPGDSVVLTDTLFVQVSGGGNDDPNMIASIRVAAGGKKLYDVLSEKGRVSTQGIFFDTGSDRIRGESTPTLKEIGDMLQQHADLKLTIEGHTDNVGQAAANKALSERRAAAVKQFLVDTYKIDAARLQTVGYGDTKPVAPNTTAEGRQNNRRVELVKM